MIGDPERLLRGTGEGTALERELLESLGAIEPGEGAVDRVWAGVARSLPALAAGGAAALVSSKAAAMSQAGGVAKGGLGFAAQLAHKTVMVKLLVGLGVGLTGAGVAWRAMRAEVMVARPARAAITKASASLPAGTLATRPPLDPPPAPLCEGAPCAQPAAPLQTAPARRALSDSERADLLSRESALLVRARAELRAGRAAQAQSTLSELETRFPRGVLGQEREVLAIELLAARGERRAAARRSKAFVLAHPKSPHSAKLARFLSGP